MLAIRSIILVFVLFHWKTSKTFLLTFEREKKNRTSRVFFFRNACKSQDIRGTQFNARAIVDSETESFTEEPFMNISRNVATIRRTLCIRSFSPAALRLLG